MNTPLKMLSSIQGDGTPVVLVGGGLTGWKSWEPFVPIFNAGHRKVICVQLINVQFGLESRPLPKNYSVKTESNALAETLASLDHADPLDIVAWSYGAFTSLEFALDHPDHIRTLTLIEPPAIWVLRQTGTFDAEAQQAVKFFDACKGDITEDMLASFLVNAGLVPPGRQPRQIAQWSNWVPFRQSLRNNPYVISFDDSIERLKELIAPVLLVRGTGSTKWLHHIIDGLAQNLPNARVVEYLGGHAPHLVSRDRFLEELEAFHRQ